MQQTKSEKLFAKAQKYIPGGVTSPVRSFLAVWGRPPFIARAGGSHTRDADGHEVANPTGASMVRIERDERGQVLAYTRYAPDGRTL